MRWAGSISSQASKLDQPLAWKLKYCNEKTIVIQYTCTTQERMDKGVVIPEFSARHPSKIYCSKPLDNSFISLVVNHFPLVIQENSDDGITVITNRKNSNWMKFHDPDCINLLFSVVLPLTWKVFRYERTLPTRVRKVCYHCLKIDIFVWVLSSA